MMQHDNPIQQIASEFAVKLRLWLLTHSQAHFAEFNSLRLIDLFEAINQWAALNRDAAGIVGHAGVCRQHLRHHWKLQADHIPL